MDLDPPLHVSRLRASVPRPDRTGLKEQLLRRLWLTHRGEGAVRRRRGEPVAAEAGVTLQQPEACRSPGEVVPGSRDPGSGGLHRLLGGAVWRVICARTQASWWQQQQPQCLPPIPGVRTDNRSSCPSLGSVLIAAARARFWSLFRRRSESPLPVRCETKRQEKVSCLFSSCRLFPGLPPG